MARTSFWKVWRSIDEILELLIEARDALDPEGRRGKEVTSAETRRVFNRIANLLDALGITRD